MSSLRVTFLPQSQTLHTAQIHPGPRSPLGATECGPAGWEKAAQHTCYFYPLCQLSLGSSFNCVAEAFYMDVGAFPGVCIHGSCVTVGVLVCVCEIVCVQGEEGKQMSLTLLLGAITPVFPSIVVGKDR